MARARKDEVLEGQHEELECAAVSKASGSEHARRTARLGDVLEVMQAYSMIEGRMRSLRPSCSRARAPSSSLSIRPAAARRKAWRGKAGWWPGRCERRRTMPRVLEEACTKVPWSCSY